jgi:hypothetical protein
MPITPRALVDLILLGPAGDRRQLQDSPVLGDVWLAFAAKPDKRMDLLITPYRECPAGPVAKEIANALRKLGTPGHTANEALVAYLQGLVAARLSFQELLRVVVPRTCWWKDQKVQEKLTLVTEDEERLLKNFEQVVLWTAAPNDDRRIEFAQEFAKFSSLDRYTVLAGVILWGAEPAHAAEGLNGLAKLREPSTIVEMLKELFSAIVEDNIPSEDLGKIWLISLNRKAMPALQRSVAAKAQLLVDDKRKGSMLDDRLSTKIWAEEHHESLSGWFWKMAEFFPAIRRRKDYETGEWSARFEIGRGTPRKIRPGELIHKSVLERLREKEVVLPAGRKGLYDPRSLCAKSRSQYSLF